MRFNFVLFLLSYSLTFLYTIYRGIRASSEDNTGQNMDKETQKHPVRTYREIIPHYRNIRESNPGPLDEKATTLALNQATGKFCILIICNLTVIWNSTKENHEMAT